MIRSPAAWLLGLFSLSPQPSALAHQGAPVWGDLTIEEGAVRLELRGEPEPLAQCLGLDQDLMGPASKEVQTQLEEHILRLFEERNLVQIDGLRVRPRLERLALPEDSEDEDGWLVVEADLLYPCDDVPQRVNIVWETFDGAVWLGETYVPMIIKHGRRPDMLSVYPEEPELTWYAPALRPPRAQPTATDAARIEPGLPAASTGLLALAAVGLGLCWRRPRGRRFALTGSAAALLASALLWDQPQPRFALPWKRSAVAPPPGEAIALFERLHRNVYAAFDAATEDEIYELLAVSVAPSLLDELYVDIYESLILREDGGAVCSIDRIEVLDTDADFRPGDAHAPRTGSEAAFDLKWNWRVHGRVAHWGHIHERVNEYRARYTVEHDGSSWKIADVEVLEHSRVEANG